MRWGGGRLDGAVASFRIRARSGARVHLAASRDDTHDGPKLRSVEAIADASGVATVSFPGLDRAWLWHLEAVVDGLAIPAGAVAP